jgi:hypothetical protein
MHLGNTDVLCIYGFREELYKEFATWLKEVQERYLVFIEDDQNAYIKFLQSFLVGNPQVKAFLITEENEEEVFKQIAWEFVFLRFSYLAHPEYLQQKEQRAKEIFAKMTFFQSGVDLLASDYSDFGIKIWKNIRKNSAFFPLSYFGEALKASFQKIPAIICGAGPSLAKNIHLLHELTDRALIFAGGSSLKILSDHQITAHFAASLDPDPPYRRFLEQSAFEVPFFFQSRLSSELLLLVQGVYLWISDSGGYPLERWLAETLHMSDRPFEAGWNVGNFCSALAVHLGCDPIIFVGMDLSCSGERVYAPGVEEPFEREKFLLVHNTGGKPFYSRRDWVMAAEWTESCMLKNPDRLFINATEGGIGFKGMKHASLQEVKEDYLTSFSYDLQAAVHAAIQNLKTMPVTQEAIKDAWHTIDESFARVEAYCDRLLSLMQAHYPASPHEKGEYVLTEFELDEELVAIKFLNPLWDVWKFVFKRKMPDRFAPHYGEELSKLLFYKRVITGMKENG